MKIVFGVLLVAIFSLVGFIMSIKYSERRAFYSDFYSFNSQYILSVSLSKDTLYSILEKNDCKSDFYKVALAKIKGIQTIKKYGYLKSEDYKIIDEYFDGLGKGDGYIEKRNALKSEEILKEKKKSCEQEEKKYKPLFIKLGLLFGAIVFILLI